MHLHLVITGRVQGVFYRGAMQDEARRHEVRGWVRNRVDGSVEAVLEGDAVAVRAVAEVLDDIINRRRVHARVAVRSKAARPRTAAGRSVICCGSAIRRL